MKSSALCLSGHLRTLKYTYPSLLENVIKPLNCDIFIHTWDHIGAGTGKNAGDNQMQSRKTLQYLQEIDPSFVPKMLLIEEESSKLNSLIQQTSDIIVPKEEQQYVMKHIGLHWSMFYSLKMANDLKKSYEETTQKSYDLVIRCRPDLHFYNKLSFDMFPDPNIVYLPEIATYTADGLNDQLAFGSSIIIDKYSDIYYHIPRYYREHTCTARPESMIKYYFFQNKIRYIQNNIKYDMWRLDGSVMRQHKWHAEFVNAKFM